MCVRPKPAVRGHKQQRQTVRKIVWNSNSNLPIKDKIDENRGLGSLLCNKLRFQHNKQHTPPLNTALLTHLLWHNLWSAVNSHYTLALGKSSSPSVKVPSPRLEWKSNNLGGRKYGKQSCGWRDLGYSSRGGRWGRQRRREGKRVTQHKNAQTARIPRNKNSQRQRRKNIKSVVVGKVWDGEVVIGRKMAAADRHRGRWGVFPEGPQVLTNTEKEFYKQQ